MNRVSKFQGGHGESTYICEYCGKRTRDTGYGEAGSHSCKKCWIEGGLENEHSDFSHDSIQFEDGIKCPTCP